MGLPMRVKRRSSRSCSARAKERGAGRWQGSVMWWKRLKREYAIRLRPEPQCGPEISSA